MLSLGEQQRLAFARLLLASPRLALLDESTSALDTDNEAHLYGEMRDAGVTFVSVGHRPTLVKVRDLGGRARGGRFRRRRRGATPVSSERDASSIRSGGRGVASCRLRATFRQRVLRSFVGAFVGDVPAQKNRRASDGLGSGRLLRTAFVKRRSLTARDRRESTDGGLRREIPKRGAA